MTVAELIEKLQAFPPELRVVVAERAIATDADSPLLGRVVPIAGEGRQGEYWIGGIDAETPAVII